MNESKFKIQMKKYYTIFFTSYYIFMSTTIMLYFLNTMSKKLYQTELISKDMSYVLLYMVILATIFAIIVYSTKHSGEKELKCLE